MKMPVVQKKRKKKTNYMQKIPEYISYLWNYGLKMLTDPSYTWHLCSLLLAGEIVLNIIIVYFAAYTEIDWVAYMQEVEGFLNGTRDYMELKGDTGPLVYPAGFVYFYSALYYVTSAGSNIKVAQYIFCLLYVLNLAMVVRIYDKTRICPPYVFVFMCCTSYRIHSIFVLRLFNDPVAMMFLYISINFFLDKKWYFGCAMFSFAVSIKMNILLFAPALFVILLIENGILQTAVNLLICLSVQIVLALPFLLHNPVSYIQRSFDFGRQFFYIWTVNWRLVPEDVFLNKKFQLALLACHLLVLLCFAAFRWRNGLQHLLKLIDPRKNLDPSEPPLLPSRVVLMLFTSNFVGMCFSRSLHYQFYVWYYHTLPFLLWCTKFNIAAKLLVFGLIELSWNTYPSTVWSSLCLHLMHLVLLVGLWSNKPQDPKRDEKVD